MTCTRVLPFPPGGFGGQVSPKFLAARPGYKPKPSNQTFVCSAPLNSFAGFVSQVAVLVDAFETIFITQLEDALVRESKKKEKKKMFFFVFFPRS